MFYFILMIGVLIGIHEWGHFVAARFVGVGVRQFSIGVGPKIASFRRKGTEFVLSILPLGGFVMLLQEEDKEIQGIPLTRASLWKRAVIAIAGPLGSFLLAIPLYFFVSLMTSEYPAPVIGEVISESPASEAGLRAEDRIVAVNGQKIRYWHDLTQHIAQNHDKSITLEIQRHGSNLQISLKPKWKSGFWRIGIAYVSKGEGTLVHMPWSERWTYALKQSVIGPIHMSKAVLEALGGLITGKVSTKELGGPIMIFQVSAQAGSEGWRYFFLLMAALTINLAWLNLLPIPVLDGGQLLLLGIEAVQRKPLSMRTQQLTSMIGIAFVVMLMLLAFKNDIERYWDIWMQP